MFSEDVIELLLYKLVDIEMNEGSEDNDPTKDKYDDESSQ